MFNFLLFLSITVSIATGYSYPSADKYSKTYVTQNSNKPDKSEQDGQCGCMLGPQGIPGNPGMPGQHGIHGSEGKKGDKGEKGDIGSPGEPGKEGKVGPEGPAGVRGRRGDKGDSGPTGVPGPIGFKGDRGYDGRPGLKGGKGEPCPATKKVAFSVARSQKLGPVLQDTTVTFDNVFSNVGGAFDEYSSHFVCKINGTYLFMTHVLGQDQKDVYAWIMLNNKHKVPLHADSRAGYGTGSQSIIMNLRTGDQVWISLSKDSGLLNDYTTFTGYLLFEDDGVTDTEDLSNHIDTNSFDYWRWRK